jgi:rfaE bifunctional protein kinase chain/domain
MAFKKIEQIINQFSELKALIIGDLMVDSYVYGKVERISPEAPVPVVLAQKKEKRLGGAGNVALNLKNLGAEATICALLGDDTEGRDLFNRLEKRGINSEGIITVHNRPTTVKERIVAGSQQMLRIDSEDRAITSADESAKLNKKIKELIPKHDVVVFEDYDKGSINSDIIKSTISLASEHNIPVVVDPKRRNFLSYSGATLFKPNLRELREGLGIDHDVVENKEVVEAVKELKRRCSFNKVMITLSERGIYMNDDHSHHFIHAHVRQIADVSGAGDTVISIAALCEALKIPLVVQAELANLGGGIVCEYPGVVPIDREVLRREAIKLNLVIPHD